MKLKFTMTKKLNIIISSLFLVFTLTIVFITGKQFREFQNFKPEFYIREGIRIEKFSDYSPKLKGTIGDADIFVIEGKEPGASVLIIGGTHPNEPSSQLTSVLFLENIEVEKGTVYIITEANRSAFSHSHPQEASPFFYTIETNFGERKFKFGSRATNTNHQWPFPDVYVHKSSSQKMSSHDARNLNRAYPGDPNGTFTDKVAYAIKELIVQNDITITIDLHEASPEYLTNNAIVAHNREDTMKVASLAYLNLDLHGIVIKVEQSPVNLRGLSHRELGDHTKSLVFLLETSNASQGKYRGRFTPELIVTGEDKFYKKADELGLLYATPVHINERVARHAQTIVEIINAYNKLMVGKVRDDGYEYLGLEVSNIPPYDDILNNGVGHYFKEIK